MQARGLLQRLLLSGLGTRGTESVFVELNTNQSPRRVRQEIRHAHVPNQPFGPRRAVPAVGRAERRNQGTNALVVRWYSR
jgi:hypothetical protein